MSVLDIDIDIFVDPRPFGPADMRLPSEDHTAWSTDRVSRYLTERCGLSIDRPLPGALVATHDDVFERWKRLIETGELQVPFHVTHIDSHADLGLGDTSVSYVLCDLLHVPAGERRLAEVLGSGRLHEGNYLLFAAACGWISSIDYVIHPQLYTQNCGLPDVADCLFRNNDPESGAIQLRRFPRDYRGGVPRLDKASPLSIEVQVPIRFIERQTFLADRSYSHVFGAQSPRYTPVEADDVLSAISSFICP